MWKNCLLLLPVFYATASLAAAPLQYDVFAGLSRDDNITRAELDRDIVDDNILRAGASASYKLAVNDYSYAAFKAVLDISRYQDFDKLSSTKPGVQASYHFRPFSGYTATRYFVLASYTKRMVDSNQREGSATDVRIGLSKRLTDLITLRFGAGRKSIDAASNLFDADNTDIYIGLDYSLTQNNTLYTSFSSIDGDITVTAVRSSKLDSATSTWIVDDAFLELTPVRWAYKLSADTTTIRLGNVYMIDSRQAFDASVLAYDSEVYWDNNYSGVIIDLTYLYRF